MSSADGVGREERVLVLAPTPRDAELSRGVLAEAGVACSVCADLETLCREMEKGAAAAVLTEESLIPDQARCLTDLINQQPSWSDFPLLVLTQARSDSAIATWTLETLGNVTLLERPVRVTGLVSAVRAAMRSRARQYQARTHLLESQRVAQALKEADRRKDEFLAMLAHELRNPLAPVLNGLQILKLASGDPVQAAQAREMMERQVTHLARLVDDLLDVSRIMRGKIELRKEVVDLAAVVTRAVETAQPAIDAQGHKVTVALPPEPVRLEGDPVRLAQVFANLLNNAAKYTDQAGRIWLVAGLEDGEVAVRVRDSGSVLRQTLFRAFSTYSCRPITQWPARKVVWESVSHW